MACVFAIRAPKCLVLSSIIFMVHRLLVIMERAPDIFQPRAPEKANPALRLYLKVHCGNLFSLINFQRQKALLVSTWKRIRRELVVHYISTVLKPIGAPVTISPLTVSAAV